MNKPLSRKKTTLWNLFHLYLNNVISIFRGILIVPLYLMYIDSKLYGAWLATGNILMWLTIFDPGVGDVAIQKLSSAFAKNNKEEIKYQISSSVFISFGIAVLALIVGFVISTQLDLIIPLGQIPDVNNLKVAFYLSIISTALTLFYYSLSGSIIGFQRTKQLGWIRNTTAVLGLLLTVVFLLFDFKLIAIALGGLIGTAIATLSYLIYLLLIIKEEQIGYGFKFSFFKHYSKIFTFTFFSKLLSTITQNIDLIIVSRFIGLNEVTILELTRRPIRVIKGLLHTPSIALLPSIAHLHGEGNKEKLGKVIRNSSKVFIPILIIITGSIIAFNKSLINIWIGGEFYIGNILNSIIALTFFTNMIGYIFSNFSFGIGKIKTNSIVEIIRNVFTLILLFTMGYYFGLVGIVLSAFLSSLFTEFWFYPHLVNKEINRSYSINLKDLGRVFTYSIIIIVLAYMLANFISPNIIIDIGRVVIFLSICIIIIRFISPDSIKSFINIIKRKSLTFED